MMKLYRIRIRHLTGPRAGKTGTFPVRAASLADAVAMARRCWPDCVVMS